MAEVRRVAAVQAPRVGLHLELVPAEGAVVLQMAGQQVKLSTSAASIRRILLRELAWMRGRLPATAPQGYRPSSCGSFKIHSSEGEQQETSAGI